MTNQDIHKKIKDTYNSEKGKGFITHLLRSFFPMNKTGFLVNKPENGQIRDCITIEILSCKEELFELLTSEDARVSFNDSLRAASKAIANGDKKYTIPDSVKKLQKKCAPLAVTCEGSNKYLSEQTYSVLYDFLMAELISNNKHINWVIKNEKSKLIMKQRKKQEHVKYKKVTNKVTNKAIEYAKISLGDLQVLKDLKRQMDDEENSN